MPTTSNVRSVEMATPTRSRPHASALHGSAGPPFCKIVERVPVARPAIRAPRPPDGRQRHVVVVVDVVKVARQEPLGGLPQQHKLDVARAEERVPAVEAEATEDLLIVLVVLDDGIAAGRSLRQGCERTERVVPGVEVAALEEVGLEVVADEQVVCRGRADLVQLQKGQAWAGRAGSQGRLVGRGRDTVREVRRRLQRRGRWREDDCKNRQRRQQARRGEACGASVG
eukprot:1799473-Prymnesium_polylepis.1